jgi:propanol-preferring alcohol dehydrogenase
MKSSAASPAQARTSLALPSATALACPGWAGPAACAGRENLCNQARFTGYQLDGDFAEYTVADQRFCFPIPSSYSNTEAAPLLCAGLIGYRSLVMAGNARRP